MKEVDSSSQQSRQKEQQNSSGIRKHLGRLAHREHSVNDSVDKSQRPYNPITAGMAFGNQELDRIEYERFHIPGVAPAIHLGAWGVEYDGYPLRVMNADNPLSELTPEDYERYGPPGVPQPKK